MTAANADIAGDRADAEAGEIQGPIQRAWRTPAPAARRTDASCRRGRAACPSRTTRRNANAVRREPGAAGAPDAPAADEDQRDADDAFAVRGDRVERQLLAQQQQQRRDQQHAGGVADAPLQAGPPLTAIAVGRPAARRPRDDRGPRRRGAGRPPGPRRRRTLTIAIIAESTSAGRTLRAPAGRSRGRCPTSCSRQTAPAG